MRHSNVQIEQASRRFEELAARLDPEAAEVLHTDDLREVAAASEAVRSKSGATRRDFERPSTRLVRTVGHGTILQLLWEYPGRQLGNGSTRPYVRWNCRGDQAPRHGCVLAPVAGSEACQRVAVRVERPSSSRRIGAALRRQAGTGRPCGQLRGRMNRLPPMKQPLGSSPMTGSSRPAAWPV